MSTGAALYWWVSSTGLLHSLADNRDYQAGGRRTLEPGKGVAGLAFQQQAPLIIDDYPNWEGAVPWALAHGVRAAVGIPLVARGRTVGAMAVLTHAAGGFDADDLRLLSLLAAQVAPSLEAGRLDIDLAASEQRFRSLYGSVGAGVLVLSASGVVIQVNPAGERTIGLTADQMRGKTPDELWRAYGEDGSELASTDRVGPVVLRSQRPVHGVTNRIGLPDGRERWLLIDAIPVMGPDGQLRSRWSRASWTSPNANRSRKRSARARKRLPIDELKIDKTFVTEMPTKKKDGLIVRSTIDLAHALGLVAVAEGVEEASAWEMLAAQGCDLAQGYYLCRPLPAPELVRWYQARQHKAT